jgi:hypothetical protein
MTATGGGEEGEEKMPVKRAACDDKLVSPGGRDTNGDHDAYGGENMCTLTPSTRDGEKVVPNTGQGCADGGGGSTRRKSIIEKN